MLPALIAHKPPAEPNYTEDEAQMRRYEQTDKSAKVEQKMHVFAALSRPARLKSDTGTFFASSNK